MLITYIKGYLSNSLWRSRKPEYEKGQNGMAIQSIVKRVQYTTFKTTIVEHSHMITY